MQGYLRLDDKILLLTGERPVDSIARFNAVQIEDKEAAELAATVFSEDVFSIPLIDDVSVTDKDDYRDDFESQRYPFLA